MNDNVQTRWFKPVNRIGRITYALAIILSFAPFAYLYFTYGEMSSMSQFISGFISVASAYGAAWIIEPISYFPALGTAGTYMGILAGSIAQMRVPGSMIAKEVAGVEDNTQEGEIVGTCGVAGTVITNLIVLTLTAIFGTLILEVLPEVILAAMSTYILPAIFGAVYAMFGGKGKMALSLPILAIMVLLNWLLNEGYLPVPSWVLMIVAVLLGVALMRVFYKKGIIKG